MHGSLRSPFFFTPEPCAMRRASRIWTTSATVASFLPIFFVSVWSFSTSESKLQNLRFGASLPWSVRHASAPTEEGVETTRFSTNSRGSSGLNSAEIGGDISAFTALAGNVGRCLVMSDLKRNEGGDGASTGWTSWVDEASAFKLQCCIDSLSICFPNNPSDAKEMTGLLDRDSANRWLRWMKACPAPTIVEISRQLREEVNQTLTESDFKRIESSRDELLDRIGCRLILLPSGDELIFPLRTPAGGMVYGKLLFGGAHRFRILPGGRSGRRRAGERLAIKAKESENVKSWLQYGGPERKYQGADIGPTALVEIILLPTGLSVSSLFDGEGDDEMAISGMRWDPHSMFRFADMGCNDDNVGEGELTEEDGVNDIMDLSGKERNNLLESTFSSAVGGLQPQINAIVRRVLDGRVIRPVNDISGNFEEAEPRGGGLLEVEELASLGLSPVKGLLLHGPPGCGKTALAREISRALHARPPKIVAAPELLDRWVGGSEKLVRSLFADAEAEIVSCNGDASKSALHIIVIDEIDAVFRKRSAAEDSGEATRASAVNQILAKLDGVNSIPNVLLIGMTNRRELLDEALLRPGRLEVQVEIPLPDREGRREIIQIHFETLRRKGRLSQPLCEAIDGATKDKGVRQKWLPKRKLKRMFSANQLMDLSADHVTGGFSGADIAGLVRCSGSIALSRARQEGVGLEGLLITLEDVAQALEEVKS